MSYAAEVVRVSVVPASGSSVVAVAVTTVDVTCPRPSAPRVKKA
jgi:hypothetical protein